MGELLLALLVTLLGTVVIAWPLRRWLFARGLVDYPGARRSHQVVTPRGGGLAMLAAICGGLLAFGGPIEQTWVALVLMLAAAALGWFDDVRDLPVRWRLFGQLLIAVFLMTLIGPVRTVTLGVLSVEWPWLWSALGLVAVVWLINLHNFMDGSDGLLAMQGGWTGLMMGILLHVNEASLPALTGFLMAGACIGFMFWNRPPARLFMGDSGSMLVGGLVGFLALSGAAGAGVSIWTSLIICSLFVVDATATLVRRALRGRRWYTAHREHAYQQLIRRGWSHGRVLLLYGLANLLIVLPVLLLAVRFPALEMVLALGLVGLLTAAWRRVQDNANKEAHPT